MIWSIIQQVGFYAFLFLTLYFVKKKSYINLLTLYFCGIVLSSFNTYFITIWTPDKIVNLGMLFCIIFHKDSLRTATPKPLKRLLTIIIIILVLANIVGLAIQPRYHYEISPIRRLILSNITYLTTSVVLLYGTLLPAKFKEEFFPKYCRVMEFAIVTGLVHYLFNALGLEFMKINRSGIVENVDGTEVLADFGDFTFTRIYGFAGEPKGLAFCILPFIVISFTLFLQGIYIRNKIYHILFLVLGIFVLFQTFSSSALINAIVMIPLILVLGGIKPKPSVVVSCFFAIIVFLVVSASSIGISSFLDNLNARTFERGQTELQNNRQEAVILNTYQKDNESVQILGWGLGQYTFQVPGQVFNNNILIPVQSGIILTLCDFGILGILTLSIILYVILNLIYKTKHLKSPIILAFSMAALSDFIESTMHGNLTTSLMYLMIAYYMYSKQKNSIRNDTK